MGSDMHMNPPTRVKRVIVVHSPEGGNLLVLQQRWNYEHEDADWMNLWEGPDTLENRGLLTITTGITEFGRAKPISLSRRLEALGVHGEHRQAILRQVSGWLEDHARAENQVGAAAIGARILAMHAKEALAP